MRSIITGVALAAFGLLLPGMAAAQQEARVTGRVTDDVGAPLVGASVFIETLDLGTLTNQEGRYLLIVPASRATGQQVELSASLIGSRTQRKAITLTPGATITEDFTLAADPLRLDEIVVTGSGTERERQKLTVTVNSVDAEQIRQANEANVVSALAGKAPNVNVTTSSGEPGSGAYIQIRGAASITGGTQPLFVIDGSPVDNSSHHIESNLAGTVVQNRMLDLNPADIESVEILKGAAATAIYGSRGANGVVMITTKSGAPGATRVSYTTSIAVDEVNQTVPLQTEFGQGLTAAVFGAEGNIDPQFPTSWGPRLPEGTPVFDHNDEVFDTGINWENNLVLSGGSDQTTYYLSLGHTNHEGFIVGNSAYERTAVRLKGTHNFLDNLQIGGNFAYTQSDGNYIQQGSNISGLLLGALRTPPEFNNCLPDVEPCYVDPVTGLHRSYRNPNPTSLTAGRGYDNPFWIANEILNESEVGRAFGNLQLNYRPVDWLTIDYTLGADYANDERITLHPKSSSEQPVGRVIRANLLDKQYDHLLLLTGRKGFGGDIQTSVTLGQNLNHREFIRYEVTGTNVIFGTEQLDYAIDRQPEEFESVIRTSGYFAETNVDLYNQLFMTGRIRADAASTFGGDDNRFWYPSFSAAWEFTGNERIGPYVDFLDYGKIRGSWGQVGRQPPVFSNVTGFITTTFSDGWLTGGLNSIYLGQDGLVPEFTLGNSEIDPELKTTWELGLDLAVLDQRVNLGLVYYDNETEDVIMPIDIVPSTGRFSRWDNAAAIEGHGFEASLDVIAFQSDDLTWSVGALYSQNETCVTELGAETFYLGGFAGSSVEVVEPTAERCYPFGVLWGQDFVRIGRGISLDIDGDGTVEDIDEAFPDAADGTLFIAEDGFPVLEDRERVIGDPHPDWTGSIRTSLVLGENLEISGLVDGAFGQEMWNGTKGALYFFGTHAETVPYHGMGKDTIFPGVGPGAGEEVTLNWNTWTIGGLGSGFTGPATQFVEDASWVKLRDITLSYTMTQDWLREWTGFETATLTASGRNLATWTDYTGIDPESNLTGQSAARGLDYFNNPRTRAWVFKISVNR